MGVVEFCLVVFFDLFHIAVTNEAKANLSFFIRTAQDNNFLERTKQFSEIYVKVYFFF